MKPRRTALIALTGLAIAAAAGGAVAATSTDPETAILDDAAQRLDVTPQELRDALAAARDAQIDEAVKAGRLTEEQAERLKERAGDRVLGIGPGGHHGPGGPGFRRHHGPGFGPRGAILEAVTGVLGLEPGELFERLRDGQSLAEVAKAEGKTLADVKAAVRKAVKAELDEAVDDGKLTRERADEILDRVVEGVETFGQRPPRGFGRFGHPHGPGRP